MANKKEITKKTIALGAAISTAIGIGTQLNSENKEAHARTRISAETPTEANGTTTKRPSTNVNNIPDDPLFSPKSSSKRESTKSRDRIVVNVSTNK